ncbi:KaiB domain-containing protein [Hyella patelloides LEGE 07179]|uniref:KaiB domain-containing protein n=1 Tax=Hyella patelloides LEGE 07179 TaxID=945734 RepID=A0A563VNC1_9CYAN|nr:circadian clock KaiB family protein [Hyella patelloides]VEP12775.1 KaiB domain-containing protein [Hyella patelloides LEGE 07179]
MTESNSPLPQSYKGIALFTPGGDLIYAIDPKKQDRWHLHLCLSLQEILGLPEPPHFLVPAYTATIDRYSDRKTGKIQVSAEVYPAVKRYLPLLQVLFENEKWQLAPWQEEYCNPSLLETYRESFPQLWQENELIVRLDPDNLDYRHLTSNLSSYKSSETLFTETQTQNNVGYVLRLFISHDNATTEKTLDSIHKILEQGLTHPYTLKIIDISKNPEQAERDRISATPALVRVFPEPVKKIVGELDDLERVLRIISS